MSYYFEVIFKYKIYSEPKELHIRESKDQRYYAKRPMIAKVHAVHAKGRG